MFYAELTKIISNYHQILPLIYSSGLIDSFNKNIIILIMKISGAGLGKKIFLLLNCECILYA